MQSPCPEKNRRHGKASYWRNVEANRARARAKKTLKLIERARLSALVEIQEKGLI